MKKLIIAAAMLLLPSISQAQIEENTAVKINGFIACETYDVAKVLYDYFKQGPDVFNPAMDAAARHGMCFVVMQPADAFISEVYEREVIRHKNTKKHAPLYLMKVFDQSFKEHYTIVLNHREGGVSL